MKPFADLSIRQKVVWVIMLTSVSALVLMAAAWMTYDAVTYRSNLVARLNTTGRLLAEASVAMLAHHNVKEANLALAALETDGDVTAAAIYDQNGGLFARYPQNKPDSVFPKEAGTSGLVK